MWRTKQESTPIYTKTPASFSDTGVFVFPELTDQDSNLDRQNQNLQCYRYTIGQDFSNSGAKIIKKCNTGNLKNY